MNSKLDKKRSEDMKEVTITEKKIYRINGLEISMMETNCWNEVWRAVVRAWDA